jgi:2,6-dihydroxypyridine 3-monooxygenase
MPRVAVAGGSLGGLTAALTLRDVGCDVTVYERARAPLVGQGAGIVLHPVTARYLRERGASLGGLSIAAHAVRYMGQAGEALHERPCAYRFSSYNTLYRGLLDLLPTERYRLGAAVERFVIEPDGVRLAASGGAEERYDLLVCADGIRSSGRRQLLPGLDLAYAGYVAWRGTVGAGEASPATIAALSGAITYHLMPRGHLLVYPIPPAEPGGPAQLNWLWYRNVAAGAALDQLLTDSDGERREVSLPAGAVPVATAARLLDDAGALPPPLAELVRATARPFIQAIVDLEPPRMAFGRACLIGDAAFVARPHAAAGSAKAAADAWALSAAIQAAEGDLALALAAWEPGQLALGRSVLARTRAAGRRAQVDGSWQVGDPLPFGLFADGDSAMPDGPRLHQG